MFGLTIDKLRYQTSIVVHIEARDRLKRIASALMLVALLQFLGQITFSHWFLGLVAAAECASYLMYRKIPSNFRKIPIPLMSAIWLLNLASTVVYVSPALVLASTPTTAMLLAGYLWIFGIFVHTTNNFATLPLYNWTLMVPTFLTSFAIFWLASQIDYGPAGREEWLITTAFMVVYCFNTIETLHKQKDTRRALNAARDEANTRLRALEHISRHDPLTGLLNRNAFDEALEEMLAARRGRTDVAVFIIDLDGFKPINDTYSHDAGDQVLRTIAERLLALAGQTGIIARLGGDEFAMAFRSINSEPAARRLAEYVSFEIQKPIIVDDKHLTVGASVGIGLTRHAGHRVDSLCKAADQAMYRAKSLRDNAHSAVLFRPEDFQKRASLEDRKVLIASMAAREIKPYYQPKVCFETGAIIGFEALARWDHPMRGLLTPDNFLPQIDELGLQGDFLQHMARAVLNDLDDMVGEGLSPGQVSINVPEVALATRSGREGLDSLLARHSRVRHLVTLEITEDVFFARSGDAIRAAISHFRAAGQRVSLDDFGTGFASFQHLRELEFDELKIDTSFVRDLGRDPKAEVLVRGFLSMASGLGVTTIAEGVETEAQMNHLRQLGCRYGQGFLFGRAQPLAETKLRLHADWRLIEPRTGTLTWPPLTKVSAT
ncbi:EAL domain-containing protein [Loktanella sp. IMCC34160]|uniref:putative bifunctional diguanylate cyclase/phosphodiesterase n=1 Tax=Loktanella sp. IMCC34160 TaxID=2510646 RepID=UPI00101DAB7F|nr:EAL domain-containing protein [Loktanella sp. IMCC34160]RYG89703.1 EAL domain-containing protein [Loktanella sp. IMCC34160]